MSLELSTLRHSTAHLLAAAVMRLFPEAKLDVGPATDLGFYYDVDVSRPFTVQDLETIEGEMHRIAEEGHAFICQEKSRKEILDHLNASGQTYKIARLQDIPETETLTLYQCGSFIDLCRGPHVKNTNELKAFKLLSISGVYFRGKESNPQLQRIYGTAFSTQEELQKHLRQLAEAKQRDHRKLGKELQLFVIDEAVGPGLILWTPKGSIIRNELQDFILEELQRRHYSQVYTPHIGSLNLYRTSGHFPYYKDSQFSPILTKESLKTLNDENCSCAELCNHLEEGNIGGFLLKPMNCPMHIRIYASQPRSYRDLPIRLAEFGTVYRWEQSGELTGLTRVRGFTQDDAHLFCTQEQILSEVQSCLEIVQKILTTLGMQEYRIRIGSRDPHSDKYIGGNTIWESAENALRQAVKAIGLPFAEEIGEAAFYGPKIDFIVKDVIGRDWQLGTIQVDYNLPERFNLSYIGSDNQAHRPVMIHRAPFGSMERFFGLLIEHFAGDFPLWLAPEQVRLLPLNDHLIEQAQRYFSDLEKHGIRASIDTTSDKLGNKIRRAELEKVPYVGILGYKEVENRTLSIRCRLHLKSKEAPSWEDFIKDLLQEIQQRTLPSLKRSSDQ